MKRGRAALVAAATLAFALPVAIATPAFAASLPIAARSCPVSTKVTIVSYTLGSGNQLHQYSTSQHKLYQYVASGTYPTWHASAYYQSIISGGAYAVGDVYSAGSSCEQ